MLRIFTIALAFVSFTGLAQWSCGDTWTYQGYDYETIQIGNQCWFAENLRSDQYANGDVIPSNVPDSALWTTQGAQTFFSLDSVLLEERGRLYNALAAMDERGLCPSEWHVPADSNFLELEAYIGMAEEELLLLEPVDGRGIEGEYAAFLKSQSGWTNAGAGVDSYGLGITQTGYHSYSDGFGNDGQGAFWTSSLTVDGERFLYRGFSSDNNGILRWHDAPSVGLGVRCMRTVESDSNGDSGNTDNDTQGCTDPDAWNFNPSATVDDESCTYAPEVPECASVCGPGTYWDMEQALCLRTLSADLDLSGCVGMSDLLELLSQFGTCFVPEWNCGDDLNYHGYNYETVLVADDCWFAENLRTERYDNGDLIPSNVPDSALWTSQGAQTFYDLHLPYLEARGRLYNAFAVVDPRGLCPAGWHPASDDDYLNVEALVGLPSSMFDYEGEFGCEEGLSSKFKSDEGWQWPGGEGTNDLGLNFTQTGYQFYPDGATGFGNADQGSYWTSTNFDGFHFWRREFSSDDNCLRRSWDDPSVGMGVRCVQDSE